MDQEEDKKELQLLPTTIAIASSSQIQSRPSDSPVIFRSTPSVHHQHHHLHQGSSTPSLDLQLSISVRPIRRPGPSDCGTFVGPICDEYDVEALKWEAAEQIRLAAMEKAYAERVRQLSRREMELTQTEFARARHLWEKAREEVEKAERMKERATRKIDSTCMEITCHSCRQRFRP